MNMLIYLQLFIFWFNLNDFIKISLDFMRKFDWL